MVLHDFVAGQACAWSLEKKLGEGDAGEVFQMVSLIDKKEAILKRPYRSPFSGEVTRQATQIELEGRLLKALAGIPGLSGLNSAAGKLKIPALLDQSKPGTEFSDRFFIVIERAGGVDLNRLARTARVGQDEVPSAEAHQPNGQMVEISPGQKALLQSIAEKRQVPALILLRAINGLISLFEMIHNAQLDANGVVKSGIVWNDVKTEHVFWDADTGAITFIDWGNGQFLESDGATKDRRLTSIDDIRQFFEEIGKFLTSAAPDLLASLKWPVGSGIGDVTLATMKSRILPLLQNEEQALNEMRRKEAMLILTGIQGIESLQALNEIQSGLLTLGEAPDYVGTARLVSRLAGVLLANTLEDGLPRRLNEFGQVCAWVGNLPLGNPAKWAMLGRLAGLAAANHSGLAETALPAVIQAGLADDWAGALWNLVQGINSAKKGTAVPTWFEPTCDEIRRMDTGLSQDALTPFAAVNRAYLTLQADAQKLDDQLRGTPAEGNPDSAAAERVQAYQKVLQALKDEVLPNWTRLDPEPPYSNLEYKDVDGLLDEITQLQPQSASILSRALDQPYAQVRIVLDAWGRKDFDLAGRGLRQVLFWDPDRRRLLPAERAIQSSPAWLEDVRQGSDKGETLMDLVTRQELKARELRNAVGPAPWLDLILDTFSRLRKGTRPATLLAENPELANDIPWLKRYESTRDTDRSGDTLERLDRAAGERQVDPTCAGVREGKLGIGEEISLAEPLDTWAPEARGSSARVFLGEVMDVTNDQVKQVAVKIMRMNLADYSLPLFREETIVLGILADVPGVVGFCEAGFIRLGKDMALPDDRHHASGRALAGQAVRFGPDQARTFLDDMDQRVADGWLPYLALPLHDQKDSLMALCDSGYTSGKFFPIKDSLRIAIQICDILQTAHIRNIVYRDHKILHYYWRHEDNGVYIIDWNVAKYIPEGPSESERQFDLVQFGARALHHILTGRVAPGALPLGPNRPEEIEQASRSYQAQWTYDDRRLPRGVRAIIEQVLCGGYILPEVLREDLRQSYDHLPDE